MHDTQGSYGLMNTYVLGLLCYIWHEVTLVCAGHNDISRLFINEF